MDGEAPSAATPAISSGLWILRTASVRAVALLETAMPTVGEF